MVVCVSQASVLQKAVEYICALENDRSYLIACNDRLTRRLRALGRDICDVDDDDDNFTRLSSISATSSTMSKRRKLDTESSDDGIGGMLSPKVLCGELSAEGSVVDALRRQIADLQRQLERQRRISSEYMQFDVPQHRARNAAAGPFSSSNTSTPRRGSLETIVEAIRCLEGDEKAESKTIVEAIRCLEGDEKAESKTKPTESCRAAADSEELVVAAEALQFIATGPRGTSSSASAQARWQRDLADIGNAWQGCR